MSIFKSKFLLGVMVVAIMLVGFVAINKAEAASCSITMTLRLGSSGAEVMCLQSLVGASADGKFGPMTLAKVKAYQAANGLVADGVVGPMTRASLMGQASAQPQAGCQAGWAFSPVTGLPCTSSSPSTPSTGLEGGAGDITLTLRGTYSSEDVGEGEEDVEVLQVDVEADEDSDVELNSVKVEFHQATSADDRDLSDYASEVSVWLDGEKVGSDDTSDFSESTTNYFSKSISLDDAVIKAGEEGELVIAVTANDSLDSGDIDTDDWRVDLLSVRFTDGDGVTTTETGSASAVAAAGTYGKTFNFASFATANDAELTLTLEDEAVNDAHLLDSDDTNDTDQAITSVLFDASGGSDIWVDEVVATVTTTGETDESVIVVSSWIEVDGVRISEKEDVPDGGRVTYDDLDYTVEAGDEAEFVFWVTMENVDGALDDGDTVQLSVDTSETVAEDEAGETVTAAGSDPVGGTHTLYDNGIRLTGRTQKAEAFTVDGVNNDRVELTLNFDVMNYGDTTLYIPNGDTLTGTPSTSATTTAPSTSEKVGYHIQSAGSVTPGTNDISAVLSESDVDLTLKTNSYELPAGKTGTFSLKVTVATDANPSIDNVAFRALLAGLGWATSDSATSAVVYSTNLTDYVTDYATLAD